MASHEQRSSYVSATILGLCAGLGIALCGYFIFNGMVSFRKSGRFVTVKGLAEREVKADLAIWKVRFKVADNSLTAANEKVANDMLKVKEFLRQFSIEESEMELSAPRVIDLFAREYGPERLPPNRYIIEAALVVKTKKIDQIVNAAQKAIELIKMGIVLDENSYGANPAYLYTRLNDIRPQMLAEATKSARALAEQFAEDSASMVGPIRQANQGTFTIGSYEQSEGGDERSTPMKRVRVVSSIDYFLID